jgi:hypothetical protein
VAAETWVRQPGWAALIRRMAAALDAPQAPVLVAAFRVGD